MVRKVRSLKGRSFIKKSHAEVDGFVFPITTRSIIEASEIKYEIGSEIPFKIRPATKDETDGILSNHPRYNRKSIPLVQEFDVASTEYINERAREEKLSGIIEVIKYVDMDATIDEDDDGVALEKPITLWEDMGIPVGDWTAVASFFIDPKNGLGMTEKGLESLMIKIKELQGESVFSMIQKLENMSGKGMYDILAIIDEHDKNNIDNLDLDELEIL